MKCQAIITLLFIIMA